MTILSSLTTLTLAKILRFLPQEDLLITFASLSKLSRDFLNTHLNTIMPERKAHIHLDYHAYISK